MSHCLERLIYKIDDWDTNKSNGATFYTRFIDDVRYSVKGYLLDVYGEGLCKRSVAASATQALFKIFYKNGTVTSALKLDPEAFKSEFGISKDRFVKYLVSREVISGNTLVSFNTKVSPLFK